MFRENTLTGESAFISGGTSGINLVIARVLSAYGARVCIIGRDPDKAGRAADEIIEATGGEVLPLSVDVRDYDAVDEAMQQASARFGRFSIVVAGAAGNFFAPAVNISAKGFKTVVDIDLVGTFNVFRAGFDYCTQPGASFVAISAPQAEKPWPLQSHVCAAKAGVNALLKTLAMEWGPAGIRVNGISPGLIGDTEGLRRLLETQPDAANKMIEQLAIRRFGKSEDIANAVVYLSTAVGSYVNGTILDVDGGFQLGDASGDFLKVKR